MSGLRSHPTLGLSLLVLTFTLAEAVGVSAQVPLIERAKPDPVRQARSAGWLDRFTGQSSALLEAMVELDLERNNWRASSGTARCRRAHRALSEVDRAGLLEVADYRLVSQIGDGMDELGRAVRACLKRRYFELDYRLDRARRSLEGARDLAQAQARP